MASKKKKKTLTSTSEHKTQTIGTIIRGTPIVEENNNNKAKKS